MAFRNLLLAVQLRRAAAIGKTTWIRAEPHRAAFAGHAALVEHEINDGMGRLFVEFRRIRIRIA